MYRHLSEVGDILVPRWCTAGELFAQFRVHPPLFSNRVMWGISSEVVGGSNPFHNFITTFVGLFCQYILSAVCMFVTNLQSYCYVHLFAFRMGINQSIPSSYHYAKICWYCCRGRHFCSYLIFIFFKCLHTLNPQIVMPVWHSTHPQMHVSLM